MTNPKTVMLLNILQDSSFSNQITFILHIQGVFSLPGRGFHQRVTLISPVPMTLDDVIVHVRQFIIALVSVDGCSSFSDPDGFFDVPDSSVGFLVYNVNSLPVYDVVFSCRMVCKGGRKKTNDRNYRSQVVIPYVEGVSERVHRVLKKYGVATTMHLHTTLRRLLVHPKDKVELEEQGELVYQIPCKNCGAEYIGDRKTTKNTM